MRRLLPWLLVAALLVGPARSLLDSDEDQPRARELKGTVTRVVDGDTIHVRLDDRGRREKVRYIGVDTPESVKPGTPVECFAKEAAAANRRLAGGRVVRLVLDAEPRDRYGRLLAYVHAGPVFVNERMLRDGYATQLTIPPNVRHAARFRAAAAGARKARRGLWARC